MHDRGFYSELKSSQGGAGSWWRQDSQGWAGGPRIDSQGRLDGQVGTVKIGKHSKKCQGRDHGGRSRVRVRKRSEVRLEGS